MADDVPLINGLVTGLPHPGRLKLRIRSDGTPEGTVVLAVDHEGIERLVEHVHRVEWHVDVREGVAMANVEVGAVEVDVAGNTPPEDA